MKCIAIKNKIVDFIKKQPVLMIALVAMIITCCVVKPDGEYQGYFNWRTIATLFCTLAVVAAFSHIHIFEIISRKIVLKLHSLRRTFIAVVFITFVGSMLLANDMALLTFLPLGFFVLSSTGNKKDMAYLFVMQNIAANLGGMVTPFGNPQNLYLYAYYNIGNAEFVSIMLPSFLLATVLILALCFLVKDTPLVLISEEEYKLNVWRTVVYSVLFVFSLLIVFRIVPYIWGTIAIIVLLFVLDKKALLEVNYPLLLTFCVFFVFSGNMARIEGVHNVLANVIPKDPLLFGILSCQCISNVPSAVLLSHFTDVYQKLLVAVNLGGLGTPIASLASLITLTSYRRFAPDDSKRYMKIFLSVNFGLLIILTVFEKIIG